MKYGLIGERLGQSFSQEIHRRFGYEYELKEISFDKLDEFMREGDFLGINVTMPYKSAVIPYLDRIDESAEKIGAVNTVINRDGKLYGYNTDFYGMISLLDHAKINVREKKAIILGTGGTAKTAFAVLKSKGAGEILKVSRNPQGDDISYNELYEMHRDAEIIINTTPVGMYPDILGYPIDLDKFEHLSGVVDAVYNPINSMLVQDARARKIKAEGGLYMLVSQAICASKIFLDKNSNTDNSLLNDTYKSVKSEKENIVLIGMPSSGKSTAGKIIANSLGRKFVDTDDLIIQKTGMTISDFFKKFGENEFRKIESEIINELASKQSLVIATGGGAVLNEKNLSALKYNGRLYFIDRPVEALVPTESRPLSPDMKAIKKLYDERYSIYCDSCDERIESNCSIEKVAEKILENYR